MDGVFQIAGWLLVSPFALLASWLALRGLTPGNLVADNGHVLLLWGLAMIGLAGLQLKSRSHRHKLVRFIILATALGATVALSVAYLSLGLLSHARAIKSEPQRAFEYVSGRGRSPDVYYHVREDGSSVEGARYDRREPYGRVCTLVQRLDGPYGFSWVRILDRSPGPGRGQLAWPISQEDCFSQKPLSELGR